MKHLLTLILFLLSLTPLHSQVTYVKPGDLTWANFKGVRPKYFQFPSETISVIKVRCYAPRKPGDPLIWDIAIFFSQDSSYVDKNIFTGNYKLENQLLLIHEILHYEICILYGKKMQKLLLGSVITSTQQIMSAYQTYLSDTAKATFDYDTETGHGTLLKKQKEWEDKIRKGLEGLKDIKLRGEY